MDAERTLLETIAHPEYFGGIRFGIETLDQHWDEIDRQQLVSYAIEYDVGAVAKRLGWILDRLDAEQSLLMQLLDFDVQNYYPLDPQGSRDGQPNTRWRIVENLRLG
jgi:predicted transcriptional regulator of viral defense system